MIKNSKGEPLGVGHYQAGSIRVRILELGVESLPVDFWTSRLGLAKSLRDKLGLTGGDTTAYRLVHGAGDLLPGLIIDVYDQVAVVQCHSIGMFREKTAIAEALVAIMGDSLQLVYNKSSSALSRRFVTEEPLEGPLWGKEQSSIVVKEQGHQFHIDFESGQKTGFFLDQRDNRALLGRYAEGKNVLNTFCYTGGFSIYALANGAASVTSVDLSAAATELADNNVKLLGEDAVRRHQSITADVLEFLKETDRQYDVVVVDPPAYAKHKNRRHKAVQAYKRLNAQAIKRLKPGGLLFTFSCSQVVDRELFFNTIVAAGLESGRNCSVLHHLSQGADHPVNLFHPEGSYLKGLVLRC